MSIEQGDVAAWKALPIFSTMRSNLALADAFLRHSTIEAANFIDKELGFVGVEPGEAQMKIHNRAVTITVVALLYQAFVNYKELKRVKPTLEYPQLEDYIGNLEARCGFVSGMRTIRNGLFHINHTKSWRSREVTSFDEVCCQRGGILAVMGELHNLLYDLTEKVFLGELRIWPDSVYEQSERMEKSMPDLKRKLENGEINFSDYMEAILSSEDWASRSG